MATLGDVIEVSIVVKDIEAAAKRFEELFGLKVNSRTVSKEFGFKNAILPLGKGHIELMQPIDPKSAVAHFLETRGEGVYLVGFDVKDVKGTAEKLKKKGLRVTASIPEGKPEDDVAWVYPPDVFGVFLEMRKPAKYV